MKKEKISEIMDNINSKYIDEATLYPNYTDETAFYPRKKNFRYSVMKWGAAAACLAVVIAGALIAVPAIRRNRPESEPESAGAVKIGGYVRPYANKTVSVELMARVWHWDEMTDFEKYTSMELGGKPFYSRRKISEELLGDSLGSYEVSGSDTYTDKTYSKSFEARKINGISEELMVAVEIDGKYYIFKNNEYDPPSTLGELMDIYSLSDTVELHRFSPCEDGYTNIDWYYLENDGMIWQILSECRDAPFDEKDYGDFFRENGIEFSVTSEALGVYKNVFTITENGYILTNIFDWGYVFHIGEDAANRIISYAMENAEEASYEPYTYWFTGTVSGIYDGYFTVDDSVLCEDPSEGMEFRVPTDDLRVSRYVDSGDIRVGNLIRIEFGEEIEIRGGVITNEVLSIAKASLYDREIVIEE